MLELRVSRKTFVNDLIAGLVMAMASVPGALATAENWVGQNNENEEGLSG